MFTRGRRLDFGPWNPWHWMVRWLTREGLPPETPLCDFQRLGRALRPGDVVLVAGSTRIAAMIRIITQSQWSHAALYLGRLHDIRDRSLRRLVSQYYQADHAEQLLIEALLGEGTRVTPLAKYRHDCLRICRPKGLCPDDGQRLLAYAIRRLGSDYDVRQLFDLARFLVPWRVLPREWRSSLFRSLPGDGDRYLCSRLIAEAFDSVGYPILPFVERRPDGNLRFFRRNPRLFTPRDFDDSPYFEVLKFPAEELDDPGAYRGLSWSGSREVYSDVGPTHRAALSFARKYGAPANEPQPNPAAPGPRLAEASKAAEHEHLLAAPTPGGMLR